MPFSATSTGNIAVTAALATISFFAQQWAGISNYGVIGHFKGLVPPGLPAWLLPIMIPIEIISMFTKPFAATGPAVRQHAGGAHGDHHAAAADSAAGGRVDFLRYLMIPISIGLAVFIMFLEILVAFIQAYIFTLLTAIFIGMYAHPAH